MAKNTDPKVMGKLAKKLTLNRHTGKLAIGTGLAYLIGTGHNMISTNGELFSQLSDAYTTSLSQVNMDQMVTGGLISAGLIFGKIYGIPFLKDARGYLSSARDEVDAKNSETLERIAAETADYNHEQGKRMANLRR